MKFIKSSSTYHTWYASSLLINFITNLRIFVPKGPLRGDKSAFADSPLSQLGSVVGWQLFRPPAIASAYVAQLVERHFRKVEVIGSKPVIGSGNGGKVKSRSLVQARPLAQLIIILCSNLSKIGSTLCYWLLALFASATYILNIKILLVIRKWYTFRSEFLCLTLLWRFLVLANTVWWVIF